MSDALAFHEAWFPGAVGDIAALHARHDGASHGFGPAFEAKVARELGAFLSAATGSSAPPARAAAPSARWRWRTRATACRACAG